MNRRSTSPSVENRALTVDRGADERCAGLSGRRGGFGHARSPWLTARARPRTSLALVRQKSRSAGRPPARRRALSSEFRQELLGRIRPS